MAFPVDVTLREVTFGPAFDLTSGAPLAMKVTFTPSRSMVRGAPTGSPGVAREYSLTTEEGMEGSISIPVTDQAGWFDGNGNAISTDAGGNTHSYRVRVAYLNEQGREVGSPPAAKSIALPTGDGTPVDLDALIPVTTTGGVTVSVPDSWSADVAAAAASAAAAQAALEDADTLVDDLVTDTGSATRASLNATYVTAAAAQTVSGSKRFSASQDTGAGYGIQVGSDGQDAAYIVRHPTATRKLVVVRDELQARYRFGVGSAPSLRSPYPATVTIDGTTLSADGAAADKVGHSIVSNFIGGFTGEGGFGASNPYFLFGVNAFNTFGRSASSGDLAGVTTIYDTLLEAHVQSVDAATVNTLNGVMVETSSNSPVTEVRGINVVGHRHGSTGSAGVVGTAVGVNIESPTQGTTKWALRTTGTAASQFGGNLHLSNNPGTPGLLHLYSGELRSKFVTVGGSTVSTVDGVNVTSDAMLTVKSNADANVVAWLHGRAAQSGDLLRLGRDATIGTRFDMRGRLIQVNSVAPLDADLANGELSFYVDPTAGSMKLMIKARDAGGTLRTGQVALT